MSASKPGQFGEPWHAADANDPEFGMLLFGPDGECLTLSDEQVKRIAACVNALDGLDPEALPALIESAKQALLDMQYVNEWSKVGRRHMPALPTEALEACIAAFGVKS